MGKLNKFDLPTVQFLLRLKSAHSMWYEWVLMCAKTSPKTAQKAIDEACKALDYKMLQPETINVFQICHAVNTGQIAAEAFKFTSNAEWQDHLNKVLRQLRKTGYPLK